MNIINRLAHAKFNTSKMHRIPKPLKNVPANNCHLKVSVMLQNCKQSSKLTNCKNPAERTEYKLNQSTSRKNRVQT